jgi:methylase of polypeptide subunit release factors
MCRRTRWRSSTGNVRDYEPPEALDGGIDGLVLHRQILEGASERLLPGGRIYLEIGYDQGPASKEAASHYPDSTTSAC